MSEQRQDQRTEGRSVAVSAWGANAGDLEMAALDAGREFFGPEARLEVVRDYQVNAYNDEPKGRFNAQVTVREVMP